MNEIEKLEKVAKAIDLLARSFLAFILWCTVIFVWIWMHSLLSGYVSSLETQPASVGSTGDCQ